MLGICEEARNHLINHSTALHHTFDEAGNRLTGVLYELKGTVYFKSESGKRAYIMYCFDSNKYNLRTRRKAAEKFIQTYKLADLQTEYIEKLQRDFEREQIREKERQKTVNVLQNVIHKIPFITETSKLFFQTADLRICETAIEPHIYYERICKISYDKQDEWGHKGYHIWVEIYKKEDMYELIIKTAFNGCCVISEGKYTLSEDEIISKIKELNSKIEAEDNFFYIKARGEELRNKFIAQHINAENALLLQSKSNITVFTQVGLGYREKYILKYALKGVGKFYTISKEQFIKLLNKAEKYLYVPYDKKPGNIVEASTMDFQPVPDFEKEAADELKNCV